MRFASWCCVALGLLSASSAVAAPLSKEAWPECRALKPGLKMEAAATALGGRGRRAGFALVDDLPVTTYAFRRSTRVCRVQIEEGIVLAQPTLR